MSQPSLSDEPLLFCTDRAPVLAHGPDRPRSAMLHCIQCRKVRRKPLKSPKRALQRQTRTKTDHLRCFSIIGSPWIVEADGQARHSTDMQAQPSQTAPEICASPCGLQAERADWQREDDACGVWRPLGLVLDRAEGSAEGAVKDCHGLSDPAAAVPAAACRSPEESSAAAQGFGARREP